MRNTLQDLDGNRGVLVKTDSTVAFTYPAKKLHTFSRLPWRQAGGPGTLLSSLAGRQRETGIVRKATGLPLAAYRGCVFAKKSLRWEKTSVALEDAPCFRPRLTDAGHQSAAKSALSPFDC